MLTESLYAAESAVLPVPKPSLSRFQPLIAAAKANRLPAPLVPLALCPSETTTAPNPCTLRLCQSVAGLVRTLAALERGEMQDVLALRHWTPEHARLMWQADLAAQVAKLDALRAWYETLPPSALIPCPPPNPSEGLRTPAVVK